MRRSGLITLSLLLPITFLKGRIDQGQSPEKMAKTRADIFQEKFDFSDQ